MEFLQAHLGIQLKTVWIIQLESMNFSNAFEYLNQIRLILHFPFI